MGDDCCDGIFWIDAPVNFFWHLVVLRKSINDSRVCILGPPCVVELYRDIVAHAELAQSSKLQLLRAIGVMVNKKREFHPNLYLLALFTSKSYIQNDALVDAIGSDSLTNLDTLLEDLSDEASKIAQETVLKILVVSSILNGKLHFSDEKQILMRAVDMVPTCTLDFQQVKNILRNFVAGRGISTHDLDLALCLTAIAGTDTKFTFCDACLEYVGFILDWLDDPIFCGRGTY